MALAHYINWRKIVAETWEQLAEQLTTVEQQRSDLMERQENACLLVMVRYLIESGRADHWAGEITDDETAVGGDRTAS